MTWENSFFKITKFFFLVRLEQLFYYKKKFFLRIRSQREKINKPEVRVACIVHIGIQKEAIKRSEKNKISFELTDVQVFILRQVLFIFCLRDWLP